MPHTIQHKYSNVWFTIDYKCPSSKMEKFMCTNNFKLNYENVVYKFVVGSEKDLNTTLNIIIKYLLNKYSLTSTNNYIYISPVFNQIEPKHIVEFMQNNNMYSEVIPIKVQLQLHKYIWHPDTKGV